MATRGRRRRQARRERRREARKPQPQFYGGSKEESEQLRERNQAGIDAGSAQEEVGLSGLDAERANAGAALRNLDQQITAERSAAGNRYGQIDERLGLERDAASQRYADLDSRVAGERSVAGQQYADLDQRLAAERDSARAQFGNVSRQVAGERAAGGAAYDALGMEAQRQQMSQQIQSGVYGAGADAAMRDYSTSRGAILGGASNLEALGRSYAGDLTAFGKGAAGRYQSSADAAFKAATERSQRQALSLAAGRGNDSIRTALAASTASNRQAQLDSEVVRAQEMNALLGLEQSSIQGAAGIEQGAVRGAADIRSGLSAQDQAAAEIQARRQEAARNAAANMLGLRGDLAGNNAQLGMSAAGMQGELASANVQAGQGFEAARAAGVGDNARLGLSAESLRGDLANANTQAGLAFEGARTDVANNNAQMGLASNAQRQGIVTSDAGLGFTASGARAEAGSGARGQFLGAEAAMEGAQLGANQANEQARLAAQKGPMFKAGSVLFDPANLFNRDKTV